MNFIECKDFTKIDEKTYKGDIPSDSNLVIIEADNVIHSALMLYGFDEVGMFDHVYKNGIYGFLKIDTDEELQ